jgi:hypothetical protein
MTYLNGIDASFDILTPKKARALRQAGYDVFIQCLWTEAEQPTTAVGNLRTAFNAGFPYVLGYISLAGGHLGAWHVEQGLGHLPPDVADRLHTVAIDVKLPGIRNSAIREAVDAIEMRYGLKIIYTSYNAWMSYQGNPQTFVDCLLWNGFWDGVSDVDVGFPFLPFGGWRPDQVVAEQCTGGGDVFGLFADRNVWVKELLQKGDDMKIDEIAVNDWGEDDRQRTRAAGRAVTVVCDDCQQEVTIPDTDCYVRCGCAGAQWSFTLQVSKSWE